MSVLEFPYVERRKPKERQSEKTVRQYQSNWSLHRGSDKTGTCMIILCG